MLQSSLPPRHRAGGAALVDGVTGALAGGRDRDRPTGVDDAAALAAWAPRLRAVLEHVEADRVDDACTALNAVLRDCGAVPTLSRHDGSRGTCTSTGPTPAPRRAG